MYRFCFKSLWLPVWKPHLLADNHIKCACLTQYSSCLMQYWSYSNLWRFLVFYILQWIIAEFGRELLKNCPIMIEFGCACPYSLSAPFWNDVVISKPLNARLSRSTLCFFIVVSIGSFAKLRSLPLNPAKLALDHPLSDNFKAKKQFPLSRCAPCSLNFSKSRHPFISNNHSISAIRSPI